MVSNTHNATKRPHDDFDYMFSRQWVHASFVALSLNQFLYVRVIVSIHRGSNLDVPANSGSVNNYDCVFKAYITRSAKQSDPTTTSTTRIVVNGYRRP